MSELKTLKDLIHIFVYDDLGNPINTAIESDLLKAEAVKWAKNILNSKAPLMANYFKCPECKAKQEGYKLGKLDALEKDFEFLRNIKYLYERNLTHPDVIRNEICGRIDKVKQEIQKLKSEDLNLDLNEPMIIQRARGQNKGGLKQIAKEFMDFFNVTEEDLE